MTEKKHSFKKKKTDHTNKRKFRNLKYRRAILKISGEIFGKANQLFYLKSIEYIAKQIALVHSLGTNLGVVIGGGNIIRGREVRWLDTIDADLCGMIATMINGIVLYSWLGKNNVATKLSSGIDVSGIVKRSNKFEDLGFYESECVLIFVGGTGNPLFTTDTAAALRAVELNADVLIKGTKVEGVYSADPRKNRKAHFYRKLTFNDAIAKNLTVMDLAAFNICREANIPICVYDFMKYPLSRIIKGEEIGTLITNRG